MKVLFDHQIFSYQDYGGVSRYFCEIIKRLQNNDYELSVKYSNNYYLKELGFSNYKNFFPNLKWYRKYRIMLEFGKRYSLKKIKENNFDILHLTHYESYACSKTNKPIVLTYHDSLFSNYSYNARTIREQAKCFKRADGVIAISENTKKDLISLFNYPEEKIKVIYHGVTIPTKKYKALISDPYILFVGARSNYKNFDLFLDAFSDLKEKSLKLFCVGSNFTTEELNHIHRLGLDDRVFQKRATDEELYSLYQNALLYCFPSKYEGFGMPILEAMANHCPVACSYASSFPEVAGDCAVYFNSNERDSIRFAMEKLIGSSELREELKTKGFERATEFTWEKSAEAHLSFYKTLI